MLVIASAMAGYFEGTRLKAYQDVGGIWTICDGETHGVHAGQAATLAECQAMLSSRMSKVDAKVRACIVRPMSSGQRVGFDDLAYNIGWSAFCRSTVAARFNRGNVRGACEAMEWYVHANGEVLPGLVKRRHAEYQLCVGH